MVVRARTVSALVLSAELLDHSLQLLVARRGLFWSVASAVPLVSSRHRWQVGGLVEPAVPRACRFQLVDYTRVLVA